MNLRRGWQRLAGAAAPSSLWGSLTRNRTLLLQFLRRDLHQRYEGSLLGVAWSLVLPLVMLAVYLFVFGIVFGSARPRSGHAALHDPAALGEVGLMIFSGMIVHGLLTDCLVRSPAAVLSQPSYVKRIVFPLEVLPLTVVGSAGVQFLISWLVLVVAALVWPGLPAPGAAVLLGPVLMLPLMMLGAGVALALSALTVYLRDIAQVAPLVATLLLFLSPVFYPVDRLPPDLQPWMALNPLTIPIESIRAVTLQGVAPDPFDVLLHFVACTAALLAGWAVFNLTRRGFADVL